MSKIGNHRIEIQETDDYRFGWESAERGEPEPQWLDDREGNCDPRYQAQIMGWQDFHAQETKQ